MVLRQAADADDDEFGGPEWGEADHEVDDAVIDLVLRHGRGVATHEERLLRRVTLQGALVKQAEQEIFNTRAHPLPERWSVRLEYRRLQAGGDARLDEQFEPPHRDEFERVRAVVLRARARAPEHGFAAGQRA
jgi:hypothetical protein